MYSSLLEVDIDIFHRIIELQSLLMQTANTSLKFRQIAHCVTALIDAQLYIMYMMEGEGGIADG